MSNSKISISSLRISGCILFDLALLLAFSRIFGLFFIIAPVKSMLVLLVLIVGLIILNGVIIFPNMLFKSIGIPYSFSIITLSVLYVIISNVFSILLIHGSTVGYLAWELVILAAFLIILSVIASFSKGAAEDIIKAEEEQNDKALIKMQLLEIEGLLAAKENQDAILQILKPFKALKERIQSSTPFGRISGNSAVLDLEDRIKNNLATLEDALKVDLTSNTLLQLQKLIEDTRRLVINRETLNIK